ncbi:lipopolysaccharide biosynthesis protein [Ramlibacter sp. PS3R-8]|uniref:lipopolysaccharide biosynthesis protein n=1 Tax=Ramlibacter sp. PS3R-8 TaxID=3133437 RepID=UPI0030B41480
MTRRHGLVSAALVYVVANGVSAGLPFLMLPVLTRVLQPAEYGLAGMFAVLVACLTSVVGVNTHAAAGMRYFDRESIDLPRYVAACLVIGVASTALTLLAVLLLAPWLKEWTQLPLAWLPVAVLVAAAQFVVQLQLTLWQSAALAWQFGALKIAQAVLDAIASLGLVLVLQLGWEGRAGGMALANVAVAVAAFLLLLRGRWMRFPARREDVRAALRFGLPLVPHLASGMVLLLFDRFLIAGTLGLASVGIYMVAVQIGMAMGLVTDAFNRAYAPWLLETIKQQDAQRDLRIVRWTYGYFIALLAAGLLVGLLAEPLLRLLAGEQYLEAAPAILWIALGYAFGGMYFMVTNYVFYVGRTGSLAMVTFTACVVNVVTALFLVRSHGIVGAAQAALLGKIVLFAGTWWLSQRCRPMPWARALTTAKA